MDQYEQIKDDVEELRTLTEESELWIPSCSVKATPEEEKKRRAYLHENIKKAKIIIRDSRIYFEDEVGSLQNFSPVNSCDFDRLESALGLETSKEASLNYKKLQVKCVFFSQCMMVLHISLTGFKENRFYERTKEESADRRLLTRLKSLPAELPSDHIRKHPVTRRQFLSLASITW